MSPRPHPISVSIGALTSSALLAPSSSLVGYNVAGAFNYLVLSQFVGDLMVLMLLVQALAHGNTFLPCFPIIRTMLQINEYDIDTARVLKKSVVVGC